eukprot:344449_1
MGDLIVIPNTKAKQESKENFKDRTTDKEVEMCVIEPETDFDLQTEALFAAFKKESIDSNNSNQDGSMYMSADASVTSSLTTIKQIFLCEGNNCEVWFENWCRIQQIASLYFERKKSWIFGIMLSISLGAGVVLYNVFFKRKTKRWYDGNIIMVLC